MRSIGIEVPCGRCVVCKKRRQKEWIFRLEQEMTQWQHCAFITLTYENSHLPIYDAAHDCVRKGRKHPGFSTLHYPDVQKFLKNIRYALGNSSKHAKVKYFAVGEYGPNGTHRPHYHILLFYNGEHPDQLYNVVREEWNQGAVTCSRATPGRIAYCAKYACDYSIQSCPRYKDSFMHCSNREPIGFCWLNSRYAFKCFEKGEKSILRSFINKLGQRITYRMPIPRYYLRKMEMVCTYEDLQRINRDEIYKKVNNPPPPAPRCTYLALDVPYNYFQDCRAVYTDLVESHKSRDSRQHIRFEFSDWWKMFHEREYNKRGIYPDGSKIKKELPLDYDSCVNPNNLDNLLCTNISAPF